MYSPGTVGVLLLLTVAAVVDLLLVSGLLNLVSTVDWLLDAIGLLAVGVALNTVGLLSAVSVASTVGLLSAVGLLGTVGVAVGGLSDRLGSTDGTTNGAVGEETLEAHAGLELTAKVALIKLGLKGASTEGRSLEVLAASSVFVGVDVDIVLEVEVGLKISVVLEVEVALEVSVVLDVTVEFEILLVLEVAVELEVELVLDLGTLVLEFESGLNALLKLNLVILNLKLAESLALEAELNILGHFKVLVDFELLKSLGLTTDFDFTSPFGLKFKLDLGTDCLLLIGYTFSSILTSVSKPTAHVHKR